MTKEELLKPRIKFEHDYPNAPFQVGTIIQGNLEQIEFYMRFPHLFKKLEWWENLPPKDKPDYLKGVDSGIIYKVYEWGGTNPFVKNYGELNIRALLPATEQEYNDYINQKK